MPEDLVTALLLAGVDVHVAAGDENAVRRLQGQYPGRVQAVEDAHALNFDDVVVLSDSLAPDDGLPALVLHYLHRFERSLMLVLTGTAARCEMRGDWERLLIESGLRKHPMIGFVAEYSMLDEPSDSMIMLFEHVPAAAATQYPLDALMEERDLHTDMTRESGRRSDAHMARYGLAAQFVRVGDRVLDVACGLGYGCHLLANTTSAATFVGVDASEYAVEYAGINFAANSSRPMSFRTGDAEALSFVANESIDFAVSVETLEHLYHPDALLQELARVLTPGGRAFLSVPYDWSDETGKDPNPFHHHVYDWSILKQQVLDSGLLLERAWLQDAGGGQKRTHAKRKISEFDPGMGPADDGEWLLALVMKPLGPAREVLPMRTDVPNILAFDRDYHDPFLVRGLVSIGWRATSSELLRTLAECTLEVADPSQADYGAALCVRCYLSLEQGDAYHEKQQLAEHAASYALQEAGNPTVLRWQISLMYVAGLLHLSGGNRMSARAAFEHVLRFDVREFSALLGTKTVGAAVFLGQIALADGAAAEARAWWERALDEGRTLLADLDWSEVIGSDGQYQTFGIPELADMLLGVAKAVNGLSACSHGISQPGLLWQAMHNTLDERVKHERAVATALRESLAVLQMHSEEREAQDGVTRDELVLAKIWLEEQYHALNAELASMAQRSKAVEAENVSLAEVCANLTKEIERTHALLLAEGVSKAAFIEAMEWHKQQHHAYMEEASRLTQENAGLQESMDWLANQYQLYSSELIRIKKYNDQLVAAKDWLENQYHLLTGELARTGQEHSQLVVSKDWLEEQYNSLTGALEKSESTYMRLLADVGRLSAARDLLSEKLEMAEQRISRMQCEAHEASEEMVRKEKVLKAERDKALARIEYLEMNLFRRAWVRLKARVAGREVEQ